VASARNNNSTEGFTQTDCAAREQLSDSQSFSKVVKADADGDHRCYLKGFGSLF